MSIELICGDARDWRGRADLVFTHLYAPLPSCLIDRPAIINLYGNKKNIAEEWIDGKLYEIGRWGRGEANHVYVSRTLNRDPLELRGYLEDEYAGVTEWMPLPLCVKLLEHFARPGITVWDGFMGRGTIGKAAKLLDMNYIGIDIKPERVALARRYLEN